MSEVFCPNSGVCLVISNVSIVRAHTEDRTLTLDVLYAGREPQRIRYHDVWYSAFREDAGGLFIALAERLPVRAIQEAKHHSAYIRLLKDGFPNPARFLEEAEEAGCYLFLHYVGQKEEYAVLAREACVEDGA